MKLGIDFGTTNSAVAVVHPDGRPQIVELQPGRPTQRTVIHADPDGVVRFGTDAFDAYLANDLMGRFLRSLKAFLPDEVPRTTLAGTRVSLIDLVALYLRFLVDGAERVTGRTVTEVVVGRPVRFHDKAPKHAHALSQLEGAIAQAELPRVSLQLEPVAAARRYEATLTQDRTVLVGDFGGGTADFAVLEVGPTRLARADRSDDVRGTSGVPLAGDVLDGRFFDRFLRSYFGEGDPYLPRMATQTEPWEHPVLRRLRRLYDIHKLRDPELEHHLKWMELRMEDAAGIKRLRRLVFDDLGYPMARAIERSKADLCAESIAQFRFEEFYRRDLDFERPVYRGDFAAAVADVLARYDAAIDRVLARAQLADEGVDEVFLTGGTSQLPFVQDVFAARFGAHKLRSANAFTTVCEGLALS